MQCRKNLKEKKNYCVLSAADVDNDNTNRNNTIFTIEDTK